MGHHTCKFQTVLRNLVQCRIDLIHRDPVPVHPGIDLEFHFCTFLGIPDIRQIVYGKGIYLIFDRPVPKDQDRLKQRSDKCGLFSVLDHGMTNTEF